MKFTGTITNLSQEQSGTSKNGNTWRKIDAVLEYEHGQYPKAIVFSVMNAKIEELNLQLGCDYEVQVDFSSREYQGKYFMNAIAWKATSGSQTTTQTSTSQQQESTADESTSQEQVQKTKNEELPF